MPRALLVFDVRNESFTGALLISHPVGHLDSITGEVHGSATCRERL
jgi:hypothetical protein